MNGSLASLLAFTPGVAFTRGPTHDMGPQNVQSSNYFAVAGAGEGSSEFSLDGIPNMSPRGSVGFNPNPEMVKEFRVQTATYDASAGHFTGAQVNMVMKSGSNQVHASMFGSLELHQ
jgi:hypothetical protein